MGQALFSVLSRNEPDPFNLMWELTGDDEQHSLLQAMARLFE